MSRFLTIVITISFAFSLFYFIHYWWNHPYQYFAYQAQSWLQGRLDIPTNQLVSTIDFTFFNQRYYWPQGPFPSIILLPLEIIPNLVYTQSIMQLILIIILGLTLLSLARLQNFSTHHSMILSIAFLVASPMINIITTSGSSQYAQLVSVTLLSLLLLFLERNPQPLILGILNAALIATRPTSGLFFFALCFLLFTRNRGWKKKLRALILFLTPIVITIGLLALYNLFRFDNFLDNGYYSNVLVSEISQLRQDGLFSYKHLLVNFYYYFLEPINLVWRQNKLVIPYLTYNPWGLSLFIIAPFFLYSLKSLKQLNAYTASLWSTVLLTLVILLFYFNTGWSQFGPRYTADFMPIIFLLTLYSLKPPNLTNTQKAIIALSSLLNIYLQYSSMFLPTG